MPGPGVPGAHLAVHASALHPAQRPVLWTHISTPASTPRPGSSLAFCLGLGLVPAGPSEVWACTDSGSGSPGLSNHTPSRVAPSCGLHNQPMAPAVCLHQPWPYLSALVRTPTLRVQQTLAPPVPLRQGHPAIFSSQSQEPSSPPMMTFPGSSLCLYLAPLGWAGLGWWNHLPPGLPVSTPDPWLRLSSSGSACVSRAGHTPICPLPARRSDPSRSKARALQTGSEQFSCLVPVPAAPQECQPGASGLRNIHSSFCPDLSSPDSHWLLLCFSRGLVHVSSYPKGFP